MGGVVSDVFDTVGDVVGGVGDLAGNALQGVANNPIGAITSVATGNYTPLIGSALGGALGGGSSTGSLASGLVSGQTGGGTAGSYYGSPIYINAAGQQQQQQQPSLFAQMLPFLAATGGGLAQQQVNKEAAQAQADALRAAGQQAATASQFRPVGTTTRFGSSNFKVDPTTGQLISAGYTPSALAQGYQDALAKMTSQGLTQGQAQQNLASQYLAAQQGQPVSALGQQLMGSQAGKPLTTLGQQYLGESPAAIRQRYVQQQTALLAPQQEQQLASIRNNLFQTGRQGLATGATSAGGLAATNPEMAAYYNSLANQQRQIAAGADQAAQQQAQFGAGLLTQGTGLTQGQQVAGAGLYGTGLGLTQQGQQFGQQLGTAAFSPFTQGFNAQGAVEQAAQQPMDISSSLASQFQKANQTGAYYNLAGQNVAANAMLRANQVSPFADILTALGKTPEATTALGSAVGGLFGGLLGGNNAQAGQTNSSVNLSGLGDIFSSDALNFGGWNSGGSSVYNPDAFSLGGDYGIGTNSTAWDTSGINGWW